MYSQNCFKNVRFLDVPCQFGVLIHQGDTSQVFVATCTANLNPAFGRPVKNNGIRNKDRKMQLFLTV